MKVLMLSLDSSILRPHSASFGRMESYGALCEELCVIVLGAQGKAIKEKNISIYPTSGNRIISLILAKKRGAAIVRGGGWIISSQDPFEAGLVGLLLAKKYNCRLEVQMHGDFYGTDYWKNERFLNRLRFYLGKFVLHRADGVRAVSKRIMESISAFLKNGAKLYEVPIFIEKKNDGEKIYEPGGFPKILAVGNFVPVKNHKMLIEIFPEIKKEFPDARLVILGDGPLRKDYELRITDYGLQDDILLPGHQEPGGYYEWADIFVHPSFYEGWGRAIIEAALFDLPIVMTDVGLASEVIKDGESGIVVPVNNKEALKNAILRLAKDKLLWQKLGEGAKEAVSVLPSKEEYLKKIKEAWGAFI